MPPQNNIVHWRASWRTRPNKLCKLTIVTPALPPNIDRADELANLALTADPSNVKAYWVKARAQQAKGNNEQSLHLLNIGLQLNPENIAALNLQGDIALAVNNLEQAETSLKNLRTICGQSCAAANKLQAALDLFKQTNPPKNKE